MQSDKGLLPSPKMSASAKSEKYREGVNVALKSQPVKTVKTVKL
jgi:hypothetical protein